MLCRQPYDCLLEPSLGSSNYFRGGEHDTTPPLRGMGTMWQFRLESEVALLHNIYYHQTLVPQTIKHKIIEH